MKFKVQFAPEARTDLVNLYLHIAQQAGDAVAWDYVDQIKHYCQGFADFPERGTARDDIAPGLRIVGFKRRISLAFSVGTDTVTFLRIMYGGRDVSSLVAEN